MQWDLVLDGPRVLTPEGLKPKTIAVHDGRIGAVLPLGTAVQAKERLRLSDEVLLPGLCDSHAHINEPGRVEWEGFATATRAAAAGGITTLVDMPLNCIPVTTSAAALAAKLQATRGQLAVDVAFWGGVVPGNCGELEELVALGARGCKAFLVHSGIDDFPAASEADLRAAMPVLARLGVPLLAHAELPPPGVSYPLPSASYASYLRSRPSSWEVEAVRLLIALCREYDCHVHIVHLSAADALPLLRDARQQKLPVTVETCPHYLTLAAEDIGDGHTECKCAPPIRERENCDRLWQGLTAGDIDMVVSDHSPCTPREKARGGGSFDTAWGGIASLQLGLGLLWREGQKRGVAIEQIGHWMAQAPARLAGLGGKKGCIAEGFDADLVVWDAAGSFTVSRESLLHRHKLTPYLGHTLCGRVKTTFVRGKRVYDDGRIVDGAVGEAITAAGGGLFRRGG